MAQRGEMEPKGKRFVDSAWQLLSFGLTVVGGLILTYMATTLIDPNREERKVLSQIFAFLKTLTEEQKIRRLNKQKAQTKTCSQSYGTRKILQNNRKNRF